MFAHVTHTETLPWYENKLDHAPLALGGLTCASYACINAAPDNCGGNQCDLLLDYLGAKPKQKIMQDLERGSACTELQPIYSTSSVARKAAAGCLKRCPQISNLLWIDIYQWEGERKNRHQEEGTNTKEQLKEQTVGGEGSNFKAAPPPPPRPPRQDIP
jgi:hypothetical protein